MLDAYIIDAIRQEELERQREEERRRIWLELPKPALPPRERRKDEEEPERGPVVIPFSPDTGVEEDAA